MGISFSFSVQRWSAWAPSLDKSIETTEQWHDWAAGKRVITNTDTVPALDFIPAMQRRRFSRLSRLSLHVAYAAAAGDHTMRTVFCSRHGEIHRTRGLLADIAANEPLSPMAFSLSVHNTASGLYSIASGNTAASTAVAAGRDTLAMAVIEAIGQLHYSNNPAEKILLVFADEPLPEDYAQFADEQTVPHALALCIEKFDAEKTNGKHSFQLKQSIDSNNSVDQGFRESAECMSLAFLRLLNSDASEVCTHGENCDWRWSRL